MTDYIVLYSVQLPNAPKIPVAKTIAAISFADAESRFIEFRRTIERENSGAIIELLQITISA